MNNVVQLEAFESPLRCRRIRWFLSPGAPITYPPGFQEQALLESPPITRRILLTSPNSSEAWKLVDSWDAVLVPVLQSDWSLALTVCLNQPGPALVILTPELKAPQAFFLKCQQAAQKAPTLVHFQTLGIPLPPITITYDATFFPPSKSMDENLMEATQLCLQSLMSGNSLREFVLKDAIRDLKSAGATLVVSSIGDPEPTLYWYYATESQTKSRDTLSSVIQTLLLRNSTL